MLWLTKHNEHSFSLRFSLHYIAKMLAVFFLSSLLCLTQNTLANQPVTVTTKYGDILGYQTELARVFYGIPFAKPPVNELRYVWFLSF